MINMNKCPAVKLNDFYAGLELFFDTLKHLTKERNEIMWPTDQAYYHISFENTEVDGIVKQIIDDWEGSRTSYPGWLIVHRIEENHYGGKQISIKQTFFIIFKRII